MARAPKHESALRSFVVLLLSVAAVAAVILGLVAYGLFAPSSSDSGSGSAVVDVHVPTTTTVPCPANQTAEPQMMVMALVGSRPVRSDGTVCIPTAWLTGGP